LHDEDYDAIVFVVQARAKRAVVPVIYGQTLVLGVSIVRLHGIIDDDVVGTAPGKRAADRSRQAIATDGGLELVGGHLVGIEMGARKYALVPFGLQDGSAVAGQLGAELLSVGNADHLGLGILAQNECGKSDRRADRFQAAGRHRDDQSLGLTLS